MSSSYPGNDAEKAGIISRNPQIVSAVFQDVVDVGSGSDIGDE